jgi:hypothetical protein
MTSYDELFGEENVSRWPVTQLQEIGLSPTTVRFLAEVGIPVNIPPVFTTQVQLEPSPGVTAFSFRETEDGERACEVVSCPAGSFGDVGEAEQA